MRTKCICHFPVITSVRKEGVRRQKAEVEEGGGRRGGRKDRVREGGEREDRLQQGGPLTAPSMLGTECPITYVPNDNPESREKVRLYLMFLTLQERLAYILFWNTLYKQNRKQTNKKLGNFQ